MNDKQESADKRVGSTDGLGGCGHFCEACARRDDKIKEMRGQLLWALYHHQGGSSVVGQPIRKVLGIGEYDHMTHEQIEEAQIAAGVMMPPNALVSGQPPKPGESTDTPVTV